MTPEGKVKEQIHRFLESLGKDCWYYCPVPMGYGRKGIPDFIGCFKGQFFSIEAKAPGGKLTPWQEREEAVIKEARGAAIVAWSLDDVKKYFRIYFGLDIV